MDKRDRLNALAKMYFALAAEHREVAAMYHVGEYQRDIHLRQASELYEVGVGWLQVRTPGRCVQDPRREALL